MRPRAARWRRWKRWAAAGLPTALSKQREGFYVLFYVQGTGDTVKEFERRLKVTDTVIKHLTVCTDEILQRAAKFKALRTKQEAKRRRSKPAPAPAAPPAPAENAQA